MKTKTTKRILAGALSLTSIAFFNACQKKDIDVTTINGDECIVYEDETCDLNDQFDDIVLPSIIYDDTTTTKKNNFDDVIFSSDENFIMSDELKDEMAKTIKQFGKDNISLYIYDVETKNTFSYNLDSEYNGACVVKPSVVIYLCKLAENGLINLGDKLKYEGNVVSGSGYLNGYYSGYQASYGQSFSILELMYHTLYYSDNNAYRMLHHYLVNSSYYDDYCKYMDDIGANSLKVNKDIIWVRKAKAKDGANVIRDLYNYSQNSTTMVNVEEKFVDGNSLAKLSGKKELPYGQIPYYIMAYGKYDYIENVTGNFSVTKTGFVSGDGSLSCRNLISLSYGKRTYIICLLTRKNNEDLRKKTVNKVLELSNEIINEYDNYRKTNQKTLIKRH